MQDIPITVKYRDVKNINLYIRPPDARVLITAPRRVSADRILDFARSRAEWIEKARERMLAAYSSQRREAREFITDEQARLLREKVEAYARRWEPVMGVHAQHWTFRYMKTRWGSCSTDTGRIRINTRLVFYPDECVEYIVVHELCHLIEPSHNRRFYSFMEKFLPDYRERKNLLSKKAEN